MSGQTAEDRLLARVLNCLDQIQQLIQSKYRQGQNDEDERSYNAMIWWFSSLLDIAQERIVRPYREMVVPADMLEEDDAA